MINCSNYLFVKTWNLLLFILFSENRHFDCIATLIVNAYLIVIDCYRQFRHLDYIANFATLIISPIWSPLWLYRHIDCQRHLTPIMIEME